MDDIRVAVILRDKKLRNDSAGTLVLGESIPDWQAVELASVTPEHDIRVFGDDQEDDFEKLKDEIIIDDGTASDGGSKSFDANNKPKDFGSDIDLGLMIVKRKGERFTQPDLASYAKLIEANKDQLEPYVMHTNVDGKKWKNIPFLSDEVVYSGFEEDIADLTEAEHIEDDKVYHRLTIENVVNGVVDSTTHHDVLHGTIINSSFEGFTNTSYPDFNRSKIEPFTMQYSRTITVEYEPKVKPNDIRVLVKPNGRFFTLTINWEMDAIPWKKASKWNYRGIYWADAYDVDGTIPKKSGTYRIENIREGSFINKWIFVENPNIMITSGPEFPFRMDSDKTINLRFKYVGPNLLLKPNEIIAYDDGSIKFRRDGGYNILSPARKLIDSNYVIPPRVWQHTREIYLELLWKRPADGSRDQFYDRECALLRYRLSYDTDSINVNSKFTPKMLIDLWKLHGNGEWHKLEETLDYRIDFNARFTSDVTKDNIDSKFSVIARASKIPTERGHKNEDPTHAEDYYVNRYTDPKHKYYGTYYFKDGMWNDTIQNEKKLIFSMDVEYDLLKEFLTYYTNKANLAGGGKLHVVGIDPDYGKKYYTLTVNFEVGPLTYKQAQYVRSDGVYSEADYNQSKSIRFRTTRTYRVLEGTVLQDGIIRKHSNLDVNLSMFPITMDKDKTITITCTWNGSLFKLKPNEIMKYDENCVDIGTDNTPLNVPFYKVVDPNANTNVKPFDKTLTIIVAYGYDNNGAEIRRNFNIEYYSDRHTIYNLAALVDMASGAVETNPNFKITSSAFNRSSLTGFSTSGTISSQVGKVVPYNVTYWAKEQNDETKLWLAYLNDTGRPHAYDIDNTLTATTGGIYTVMLLHKDRLNVPVKPPKYYTLVVNFRFNPSSINYKKLKYWVDGTPSENDYTVRSFTLTNPNSLTKSNILENTSIPISEILVNSNVKIKNPTVFPVVMDRDKSVTLELEYIGPEFRLNVNEKLTTNVTNLATFKGKNPSTGNFISKVVDGAYVRPNYTLTLKYRNTGRVEVSFVAKYRASGKLRIYTFNHELIYDFTEQTKTYKIPEGTVINDSDFLSFSKTTNRQTTTSFPFIMHNDKEVSYTLMEDEDYAFSHKSFSSGANSRSRSEAWINDKRTKYPNIESVFIISDNYFGYKETNLQEAIVRKSDIVDDTPDEYAVTYNITVQDPKNIVVGNTTFDVPFTNKTFTDTYTGNYQFDISKIVVSSYLELVSNSYDTMEKPISGKDITINLVYRIKNRNIPIPNGKRLVTSGNKFTYNDNWIGYKAKSTDTVDITHPYTVNFEDIPQPKSYTITVVFTTNTTGKSYNKYTKYDHDNNYTGAFAATSSHTFKLTERNTTFTVLENTRISNTDIAFHTEIDPSSVKYTVASTKYNVVNGNSFSFAVSSNTTITVTANTKAIRNLKPNEIITGSQPWAKINNTSITNNVTLSSPYTIGNDPNYTIPPRPTPPKPTPVAPPVEEKYKNNWYFIILNGGYGALDPGVSETAKWIMKAVLFRSVSPEFKFTFNDIIHQTEDTGNIKVRHSTISEFIRTCGINSLIEFWNKYTTLDHHAIILDADTFHDASQQGITEYQGVFKYIPLSTGLQTAMSPSMDTTYNMVDVKEVLDNDYAFIQPLAGRETQVGNLHYYVERPYILERQYSMAEIVPDVRILDNTMYRPGMTLNQEPFKVYEYALNSPARCNIMFGLIDSRAKLNFSRYIGVNIRFNGPSEANATYTIKREIVYNPFRNESKTGVVDYTKEPNINLRHLFKPLQSINRDGTLGAHVSSILNSHPTASEDGWIKYGPISGAAFHHTTNNTSMGGLTGNIQESVHSGQIETWVAYRNANRLFGTGDTWFNLANKVVATSKDYGIPIGRMDTYITTKEEYFNLTGTEQWKPTLKPGVQMYDITSIKINDFSTNYIANGNRITNFTALHPEVSNGGVEFDDDFMREINECIESHVWLGYDIKQCFRS